MSFSRRASLRLGFAALSAALAGPARAADLQGITVAVIGAGIAGLSAASTLRARGAQVIVLEATDRIGGRIRTDMSMGAPFEFGAGWIHGPKGDNPISALAKAQGLTTFETDDDNLDIYDADGEALSDADWARFDRLYEQLEQMQEEHIRRNDPRSMFELVRDVDPAFLDDPLGLWMLTAYTEFDLGAGIEDIGVNHAFEDDAFPGADVILLEGYEAILPPLIKGLDIRLNTPVTAISYASNAVQIRAGGQILMADHCICTASLGVLKSGDIAFNPALPMPVQSAIDTLGFGTVTKIAMKFDAAFWDEEIQYFGTLTDPKGRWSYWINYLTFSDEPILLGLSFGRYAPQADAMSDAEMTADALDVLQTVWEDDVPDPVQVLTTRWSQEPFFKGAYSYPQKGGSSADFKAFEANLGRLHFAGEHTIFRYHSTTHGALLSGRRAANAVMAQ